MRRASSDRPFPSGSDVVFLLDVDNTLLDNDRIIADLRVHLAQEVGAACADRYWAIFERLRHELGYADYLGDLQRYRAESDRGGHDDHRLLLTSSFLVDYPFAERLYPGALEVVACLGALGPTVILTVGDVVFQPRTGRDPGELYADLAQTFGHPVSDRVEAPATARQKGQLAALAPESLTVSELAGEQIESVLDKAPGNGAPIGGIKVIAKSGWFAARPSGTEDIYKIYAESFADSDHLQLILQEARAIVDRAIALPAATGGDAAPQKGK